MRNLPSSVPIVFLTGIVMFTGCMKSVRGPDRTEANIFPSKRQTSWANFNNESVTTETSNGVYEVMPGPATVDPDVKQSIFSDSIEQGEGAYRITVLDQTPRDSKNSKDEVTEFNFWFKRADGTKVVLDNFRLDRVGSDKAEEHFGGVGIDQEMHGHTGRGDTLMPKLMGYIVLWGKVDIKDGDGEVLFVDKPIHAMITSGARNNDLQLVESTRTDKTEHYYNDLEAHFLVNELNDAPSDEKDSGDWHGFLHVFFKGVELKEL